MEPAASTVRTWSGMVRASIYVAPAGAQTVGHPAVPAVIQDVQDISASPTPPNNSKQKKGKGKSQRGVTVNDLA